MKEVIVEERVVFRGRQFRVLERDIRLSETTTVTWEVLDKGWDSAMVVAVDDEMNVYLVEEYSGGTNERSLCLPKGRIDPGETPAEAASRELREEICMGGRLERLVTISVSPGYLTQRTAVFLATDLYPDALRGDEIQHLMPVRLPFQESLTMCVNGQISEARTIASLLIAARKIGVSRADARRRA